MFIPPAFAEDRPEELREIIRATSLPILVSPTISGGLIATHLLLRLTAPDRLVGHVSRGNPHWREADPNAGTLAIFAVNDGYVSPSWYPSKAEGGKVVPTWNYQAVHATGRLELIHDPAALLEIVTGLTDQHEAGREHPWAVSDAPDDYIAAQLKGIVGVVLHVTKLEGKAKLSQNRLPQDREGVIAGAAQENPAMAAAVKKAMTGS